MPVLEPPKHKLDIVIAHFHTYTLHELLSNWSKFLEIGKVGVQRTTKAWSCHH